MQANTHHRPNSPSADGRALTRVGDIAQLHAGCPGPSQPLSIMSAIVNICDRSLSSRSPMRVDVGVRLAVCIHYDQGASQSGVGYRRAPTSRDSAIRDDGFVCVYLTGEGLKIGSNLPSAYGGLKNKALPRRILPSDAVVFKIAWKSPKAFNTQYYTQFKIQQLFSNSTSVSSM